MKAPFKKVFIARYILYLEILGFAVMSVIVTAMVFCVFTDIDDVCKVKTDPDKNQKVSGTLTKIKLPAECYVTQVHVKDSDKVTSGQSMFTLVTDEDDLAILHLRADLKASLDRLEALVESGESPPDSLQSLKEALASAEAVKLSGKTEEFPAPMNGIVKENPVAGSLVERKDLLQTLPGTFPAPAVCELHSFDVLRVTVILAGKNAARVRINRLAQDDIKKGWKGFTRKLLAGSDPRHVHLHDKLIYLLEKERKKAFKYIKRLKAGKKPPKPDQNVIINTFNLHVLRMKDLYNEEAWAGVEIGDEARALVDKQAESSLTDTELVRLNRLLLQGMFPDEIEESKDERQKTKAKIIVEQPDKMVDGKLKEEKPLIFKLEGKVAQEPAGLIVTTVIELRDPPDDLREHLEVVLADPYMDYPQMVASIVVKKIKMFKYLFSKE